MFVLDFLVAFVIALILTAIFAIISNLGRRSLDHAL